MKLRFKCCFCESWQQPGEGQIHVRSMTYMYYFMPSRLLKTIAFRQDGKPHPISLTFLVTVLKRLTNLILNEHLVFEIKAIFFLSMLNYNIISFTGRFKPVVQEIGILNNRMTENNRSLISFK